MIHALLVGINTYHPGSGVSNLAGCVGDIQNLHKFLQQTYAEELGSVTLLLNEEATRERVEAALLQLMQQGKGVEDTLLFVYAGHGSWKQSAPEFSQVDGMQRDETLVLYDSRLPGGRDLTDKELGYLLTLAPTACELVIIADSCHSATISRSTESPDELREGMRARFTAGNEEPMSLDDYTVGGKAIYREMQHKDQPIRVPSRPHVAISACQREQFAWETKSKGGLFSFHLLNALQQKAGQISYHDLFRSVDLDLRRNISKQQPHLTLHQFDSGKTFLRSSGAAIRRDYTQALNYENGEWRLKLGAIHGVPTDRLKELQVAVYGRPVGETSDLSNPARLVGVKSVHINYTVVEGTGLQTDTIYHAALQNLPPQLVVGIAAQDNDRSALKKTLKQLHRERSPIVEIAPDLPTADYQLVVKPGKVSLNFGNSDEAVATFDKNDLKWPKQVIAALEHLAQYRKLYELSNPKTRIDERALEVRLVADIDGERHELAPGATGIPLGDDGNPHSGHGQLAFTMVQARNRGNRPLFVSALVLLEDHSIINRGDQMQLAPGRPEQWVDLITEEIPFGLPTGQLSTENSLRVLASTQQFDERIFLQQSLKALIDSMRTTKGGQHRAIINSPAVRLRSEDWTVVPFDLKFYYGEQNLATQDVEIGSVRIKQHPFLQATVGSEAAGSGTRSADAYLPDFGAIFRDSEVNLVSLSPPGTRSAQQQQIITLSGIKNEATLRENPLEIELGADIIGTGEVIPVTYDGEFLVPFGSVLPNKEGGGATILVHELPDQQEQRRSPTRAVWFALLRAVGLEDRTFLLRQISGFDPKGRADRTSISLPQLQRAKRVLLCIHGIIGDTASIVNELQEVYEAGTYDVILTFDYECLTNSIDKTAEKLNEKLAEVGIHAGDGKHLDIIAHSMGGLVSRWMIEKLQNGNDTVDRLIMFGTPNRGSAFGDLPRYGTILTKLLTLGLNYAKHWIGPVGGVLKIVNGVLTGANKILVTLDEMSPSGEFITRLNKKPPLDYQQHTEYSIVAGDITNYAIEGDTKLARLLEKVLTGVGGVMYSEGNDVAVATNSITYVSDSEAQVVLCHHLNYFVHPEGRKHLFAFIDGGEVGGAA